MNDYNGPDSYSYDVVTRGFTLAIRMLSVVGMIVCVWLIAQGELTDRILGVAFILISIGAFLVTSSNYRRMHNIYTPSEHGFNWHDKTHKERVSWSEIGRITTHPMDMSFNFYDRAGIKRFSLDKNIDDIEWLLKRILDHVPPDTFGKLPKSKFVASLLIPAVLIVMVAAFITGIALGVITKPVGIAAPLFVSVVMLGIWASYFKIVRIESQGLRVWAPFLSTLIPFSAIRRVILRTVVLRTKELGLVIQWGDDKETTIRLPLIDVMRLYVQIREGRKTEA